MLGNAFSNKNSYSTNEIMSISNNVIVENKVENEEIIDKNIWMIEIPKIDLVANISNGTSEKILNQYVGHFDETPKLIGNVGLAGHNRGYNVNYFSRLKELEIGDEIFYTYSGEKKKYVVDSKNIIKDTDWNRLKNTKENRLTLITCVENQPEYRRCIQAKENI